MDFSSKALSGVIAAFFGIVWSSTVAIIASHFFPTYAWVGAVFYCILSVVIAIVYLLVFRFVPSDQAEEVGAVSLVVTAGYLAVSAVVNTIHVFTGHGYFSLELLLVNLCITFGYVVWTLLAEKHIRNLAKQMDKIQQKMMSHRNISAQIGQLLAMTKDDALYRQLLRLKEIVDCSTNITTASTNDVQADMSRKLEEIHFLMSEGRDYNQIQSKIQEAESCWKTRSSVASGE